MSLPKKGVITKISSISLFVFLMLFNVKVAFSDKSNGDIDILGMKISVSVPSAYASMTICESLDCHGGPIYCDSYYIQFHGGGWQQVKCWQPEVLMT